MTDPLSLDGTSPRLERTQGLLERSLAAWGAASITGGAVLVLAGRRTGRAGWVAAGQQHAGWGAVDVTLAAWGWWRRTRRSGPDLRKAAAEAAALRRLLTVNAGLDVGYVAAGAALALAPERILRRWPERVTTGRATGTAVVVQGAFLLVLDVSAARRLELGGPPVKRS